MSLQARSGQNDPTNPVIMKKSNEQTLSEAIRELIETYRIKGKLDEVKLIGSWEKVTGKVIMKYTRDIYIRNRKLYLRIDSPALKNELLYSRSQLVDSLNKEAGSRVIEEIVFL